MRRILAIWFLVSTVTLTGVVFAEPGDTIPLIGDCKDAPEPSSPVSGGAASFFHVGHATPIPEGDPFADGSPVSIVDQYGYGGLTWSTYDLGCGGAARDPWATFLTGAANFVLTGPGSPTMLVAMTGQLGLFAMDNPSWWLGIFDHPIEAMAKGVRERPMAILMPITLGLLAVVMVAKHKKMQLSHVASGMFWAVVILGSCVLLLAAPLKGAQLLDEGVQWSSGMMREAFGGNSGPMSSVGPVHQQMLYQTWLAGEFGDADSDAAKNHGAELFKAQTYSWAEWEKRHSDPDEFKDTHDRKQADFKEIAQKIHDEDLDAYANLQGKHSDNRITHAFLGAIGVYGACLFVLFSFVMLAVALLTIRVFVIGWPLIAIIGVLPSQRHHLFMLWNKLAGAILRAVVYMASAGFVSVFVGAILASKETPAYLKLFLILLINGIAWFMLMHWYAKRAVGVGKVLVKYMGGKHAVAAGMGQAVVKTADRIPSDDRGGRFPMGRVPHEAMQSSHLPVPVPTPGTGWERIESTHPGYWVREPTVRGPRLTTGFDIGTPSPGSYGLPAVPSLPRPGMAPLPPGVRELEPIDMVHIGREDEDGRYIPIPRTTTRHVPLAIEERTP